MAKKSNRSNEVSYDKLMQDVDDKPFDDAFGVLADKYIALKKQRDTERFCFFIMLLIWFDVTSLLQASNWAAPIIIGALELIVIVIISRAFGIPDAVMLIDKILGVIRDNKSDKE